MIKISLTYFNKINITRIPWLTNAFDKAAIQVVNNVAVQHSTHTHTTGKHLATTVLLGSLHINAMCFSHVRHVLAICYLWS